MATSFDGGEDCEIDEWANFYFFIMIALACFLLFSFHKKPTKPTKKASWQPIHVFCYIFYLQKQSHIPFGIEWRRKREIFGLKLVGCFWTAIHVVSL